MKMALQRSKSLRYSVSILLYYKPVSIETAQKTVVLLCIIGMNSKKVNWVEVSNKTAGHLLQSGLHFQVHTLQLSQKA